MNQFQPMLMYFLLSFLGASMYLEPIRVCSMNKDVAGAEKVRKHSILR